LLQLVPGCWVPLSRPWPWPWPWPWSASKTDFLLLVEVVRSSSSSLAKSETLNQINHFYFPSIHYNRIIHSNFCTCWIGENYRVRLLCSSLFTLIL
jgi:hypothetical protein